MTEAIDLDAYKEEGGYALLKTCIAGELEVDDVIRELQAAGLRGPGGSGLPVAECWRALRSQPLPRLLVANGAERARGSFEDRALLERDPHRIFEGMLIAAWAVGAGRIRFHLRADEACRALLERELARLRSHRPYPGMPEIELLTGAPEPERAGQAGRPTLIHDIETLHWVRDIVERGGAWFAAQGRRRHSVSGRVPSDEDDPVPDQDSNPRRLP